MSSLLDEQQQQQQQQQQPQQQTDVFAPPVASDSHMVTQLLTQEHEITNEVALGVSPQDEEPPPQAADLEHQQQADEQQQQQQQLLQLQAQEDPYPLPDNYDDDDLMPLAMEEPSDAVETPPTSTATTTPTFHYPAATRVNGLGLWMSWTRNFKNPQAAFLDLMDNAIDAADVTTDGGKIEVALDDPAQVCAAGIVILNNSHKPIKEIRQILEVYHSTKLKGADSVGENGVGLKQGCAALANLSFIIIRNDDELYLGVLAKKLQREQGVCLPSYLIGRVSDGVHAETMLQKLTAQHPELAVCLGDYGAGNLELGTERMAVHIRHIVNNATWNREPHVFMVILNQLVHANRNAKPAPKPTPGLFGLPEPDPHVEAPDQETEQTEEQYIQQFLNELRDVLPRHYIHIPSNFHFLVDHQHINFEYWQKKLVEMTVFEPKIIKTVSFRNDAYWKEVRHRRPEEWYSINVYLGFDPDRVESSHVAAELRIYSRHSGRLISHVDDARTLLGLTAGGTQFCQGLTIIVDDYDGRLPLNPTKQDLAFGEEEYGESHRDNLYAWIGAVAWSYWKKFFLFCGEEKKILTERIIEAKRGPPFQSAPPPPLRKCQFNRFFSPNDSTWILSKNKSLSIANIKIRSSHKDFGVQPGPHALYRIQRGNLPLDVKSAKLGKQEKKRKRESNGYAAAARAYTGTNNNPIMVDDDIAPAAALAAYSAAVGMQPMRMANASPAAAVVMNRGGVSWTVMNPPGGVIQPAALAAAAATPAQQAQGNNQSAREAKWKQRAKERGQHIRELEAELGRVKENQVNLERRLRQAPRSPGDEGQVSQLQAQISQLKREKIEYSEEKQNWERERIKLQNDLKHSRDALQRALHHEAARSPSRDEGGLEARLRREKSRNSALYKENEALRAQNEALKAQLQIAEQQGKSSPSLEDDEEW